MLQIVHDLAPSASLSFATAFSGLFEFADNIRDLRSAGADIISDDVYYAQEPFFQEGPVNVAISDVVSSGALYFTSAGNSNLIVGGKNVASYEAPSYRPSVCPTIKNYPPLEGNCHDFDPSGAVNNGSGFTLANGGRVVVDFQWAEPWYNVTDDLDIYLLDDAGNIVSGSDYVSPTEQVPFEYFGYTNTSGSQQHYRIVINRYSGNGIPRLKYIFLQSTSGLVSVQYNTSNAGDIVGPSLSGHSSNSSGFSVAAVPYSDSNNPETYTSRGPAVHYFGPVKNSIPAAPIAPQTIQKPDFAATDGGCTTFFGSYDGSTPCYRFYGTSAAAPHAAAVTALLLQRASQLHITLTSGLAEMVLKASAQPVSGGDLNSVGAGLLNALAAAGKLEDITSVYLPAILR